MTWGVSTARRRPGDLLTRGDVCHLHADRDGAERCGAAGPGAPDLVRLEQYSERVYRVLWSLSDTSGGELRRPLARPGPFVGPQLRYLVARSLRRRKNRPQYEVDTDVHDHYMQ